MTAFLVCRQVALALAIAAGVTHAAERAVTPAPDAPDAQPSFAETITTLWTRPERVASRGSDPQLAADAEGHALIVWQADGAIWARSFAAGVFGEPVQVSAGTGASSPVVTVAAGQAVAAWLQADGDIEKLLARRYSFVRGWGATSVLSVHDVSEPASASQPAVTMDATGQVLALWVQPREIGGVPELWSAETGPGRGWNAAQRLGGQWVETPRAAFDGNGNAVAVWTSEGMAFNSVRIREYVAGRGWGPVILPWGVRDEIDHSPRVAVNRKGDALAIWVHRRVNTLGSDLYVSHRRRAGWGTPVRVEWDDVKPSDAPQVALDENGNALAVWQQGQQGAGEVWYAVYQADAGWRAPQRLQRDRIDGAAPQLVMRRNGDAFVLWRESDVDGERLVLARLREQRWLYDALAVTAPENWQLALSAAEAFALWQQPDGIWMSRLR